MRLEALAKQSRRLELCVEHSGYQINPDRTELIWFGSRCNLVTLGQLDTGLNLSSVVMEPVDAVRDLGVIRDIELSMAQHIGKLTSLVFFHIRRLRKFQLVQDSSSIQRRISAFVMLRLDYCNAVLVGLAVSALASLLRVLNAADRLLVGTAAGNRMGNAMRSLHWLPIVY